MKWRTFACAACAGLLAACVFAGTAAAAPASRSAARAGRSVLAHPENTKFEVEYENAEFYGPGMVHCVGHHQVNEKRGYGGTETSGGRDVEKCKTVSGQPFEKLTGGETREGEFPGPANIWESDYFLFVKGVSGVRTHDMKLTVSANDRSFRIVAYYNEG
jgi:hypothetical protein